MSTAAPAAESRLLQTLALLAAIGLVGSLAAVNPLASWVALALDLLGSLALLTWRALVLHEAEALFPGGAGLRRSLLWGGGLGSALLMAGLIGLPAMGAAVADNSSTGLLLETVKPLLFDRGLVLLLPLLVLAEEGLWRGLLLPALLERGLAPGWAMGLSTLGFSLNHLAVAPLALVERTELALMALPLGLITALLTWRKRSLWGAVLLHGLVMGWSWAGHGRHGRQPAVDDPARSPIGEALGDHQQTEQRLLLDPHHHRQLAKRRNQQQGTDAPLPAWRVARGDQGKAADPEG